MAEGSFRVWASQGGGSHRRTSSAFGVCSSPSLIRVQTSADGEDWDSLLDGDTLEYLRQQSVSSIIDEALHALATEKPADARGWLARFIGSGGYSYPPRALAACVQGQPEWITAGCGDGEYRRVGLHGRELFRTDLAPPFEQLPAASASSVLLSRLSMYRRAYGRLRMKVTRQGVTLAKCIKAGMDVTDVVDSCPAGTACGLFAGDPESYECFREIFDDVVLTRHGRADFPQRHPTDTCESIVSAVPDAPCAAALEFWVTVSRSITGFRLPPSVSFDERRRIEDVVVRALDDLQPMCRCTRSSMDLEALASNLGKVKPGPEPGQYTPVHWSRSRPSEPMPLAKEDESHLRRISLRRGDPRAFDSSRTLLSAGIARHWPDARGVWWREAEDLFVWVNDEDHIRIVGRTTDGDLRAALRLAYEMEADLRAALGRQSHSFVRSDRLGFVTACPATVGTAMRITCSMSLPHLFGQGDSPALTARQLSKRCGVHVAYGERGRCTVTSLEVLGSGEAEVAAAFHDAISELSQLEEWAEAGELEHGLESRDPLPSPGNQRQQRGFD